MTTVEEFEAMKHRTEAAIARARQKFGLPDPMRCYVMEKLPEKAVALPEKIKPAKRINQNSKPLMNKLESEWFAILNAQFPNYPRPRAQAKRYKIANGAWYKPDITCSSWPVENSPAQETAFECKGPKQMKNIDRGILTIKTAAHQWPEVRFVLVWKENGQFKTQHVLP